jgi:glyoxylase-like metal-dependent hydrolase (beta-lactamase superfamily II)
MKEIAQDVYQIEGLRISNVYLLTDGDGLTLVDGGNAGDGARIAADMEKAGYDPAKLSSILVTHSHGDHIGGIKALRRQAAAQVIAHEAEVPYLEGAPIPSSNPVLRALTWLTGRLGSRGTEIVVDTTVHDGETLDLLGGLRVIHTPGHTPGSICLYQADRGILFSGDLIFNGHPFTGRGGLRYPPKAFSMDPEQVEQSVQKLADLEIRLLCPGHGAPVLREPGVKMSKVFPKLQD